MKAMEGRFGQTSMEIEVNCPESFEYVEAANDLRSYNNVGQVKCHHVYNRDCAYPGRIICRRGGWKRHVMSCHMKVPRYLLKLEGSDILLQFSD